MTTETVSCPDADLCGGACAKHEPDDVRAEREAAEAQTRRRLAALAADPHAGDPIEGLPGSPERAAMEAAQAEADAITRVVTIDAWTERVATYAWRARQSVGPVETSDGTEVKPQVVVHPDDEDAMRLAHSATATDGPLFLFGMRVITDPAVPTREARLRYDVDVAL